MPLRTCSEPKLLVIPWVVIMGLMGLIGLMRFMGGVRQWEFSVQPTEDSAVDGVLLVVLRLGEAHAVFLLFAILVGEDNHEVLA